MSITVSTLQLIDVLTDSLQTGSNVVGGIRIETQRAPYLAEPGDRDLLTATSTTRQVLGHTWIPVDGQTRPAVWPCASAATVLTICKTLARIKGKEHTVDLDMILADPPADAKEDEHPGWIVTLRETPALFDSDTEFQFHAHHESRFPTSGLTRMLTVGGVKTEDYEEVPLTLWSAAVLGPLVAVAKRRGEQLRFYRSPEGRAQVVQIGLTWLGTAIPSTPMPGDPNDEPSIEPVLGDSELLTALKRMKADGITVSVDNPQGVFGEIIGDAASQLDDDEPSEGE